MRFIKTADDHYINLELVTRLEPISRDQDGRPRGSMLFAADGTQISHVTDRAPWEVALEETPPRLVPASAGAFAWVLGFHTGVMDEVPPSAENYYQSQVPIIAWAVPDNPMEEPEPVLLTRTRPDEYVYVPGPDGQFWSKAGNWPDLGACKEDALEEARASWDYKRAQTEKSAKT